MPGAHSAYPKSTAHGGRPGLEQKRGPIFCIKSPTVWCNISTYCPRHNERQIPLHSLVLTGQDLYPAGILMN